MTYGITRTAALCLVGGLSIGCGPLTYSVPSSAVAPGADAEITAEVREAQGQTHVAMEASNLTPPERLVEGGDQYVAWYRTGSDAQWSRIGTLDYDESDREGDLEGSVPATAFDLQVSIEPSTESVTPSQNVVFAQRVEDR